jgi:acetylornithine deacetylase
MKSGLIANYFALKTILDLGLRPQGKVILESVIEEEAGGSGGTLTLFKNGYVADGLVIPEPFGMKVITAHPGCNYFRVKVQGKTAHAAQSHKGVNAISKLTEIHQRLMQLDQERAERNRDEFFEKVTGRSCNLNVGTFKAGDWPSTVPGWAELEARISYLPGETEEGIKKEVSQAIQEVVDGDSWLKEHLPKIEWFGWRTEPWIQDTEATLVQEFIHTATEVLSYKPEVAASTAGLDARFGPFFNVPALIFGPTAGLLHSSNEYVQLNSVIRVIKVLTAFIVDWCGVK